MKRVIAVIGAAAATLVLVLAAAVGADSAFGPGNQGGGEGNSHPNGPSDPKCHPPGQTVEVPGCK